MGYCTTFDGHFRLDKPLTKEHALFLYAFSETRRMKRDPMKIDKRGRDYHAQAGLTLGPEGAYFVNGADSMHDDPSVVDHNTPPAGQPELWCSWAPATAEDPHQIFPSTVCDEDIEAGAICQFIMWNGGERFYSYREWLDYLILNFLEPWGYKISGMVQWRGEEPGDIGQLVIKDNALSVRMARFVEEWA